MTINPAITDLFASGASAAKFPNIGDKIVGTIVSVDRTQQSDIQTGEPLYWNDGNPRMQFVITLKDTGLNETDDDNGDRRLYAKGQMERAIKDALRDSGARQDQVIGGRLAVQYYADGEAKTRGFNPPKLYRAQFEPAAAAAVDDLLGTPAQTQQPAPVAAAPQVAAQATPQAAEAAASAEDLFG